MLEAVIDGIKSSTKRLCLAETPSIPSPERDIERKPIRGRHGSLTKKYGYKDIEFSLYFNLLEVDGIKNLIREIKPWILNAKELILSDDPDYYYKIVHMQIPEIENTLNLYGYFEVQVIAKPFQYKVNPIITLTSPGQVAYGGTVQGEPYLKVYGTGDISVTINNRTFSIKGLTEYVELESDSLRVYKGTEPKGNTMIGKFPYLDIGLNDVSWIGSITKIEIDLREAYL